MRAITLPEHGDIDVLTLDDVPTPQLGAGEVLIDVVAAGVNRADVLQRQGHYPPPPGASELPGLEVSGRIAQLGDDVTGWSIGDEVCALLTGGGYAEKVAVPAGQVLPVPQGVSLTDAAVLPETICTVWSNLVMTAGLRRGDTVLLHGGSSGIGTTGIQISSALGARVAVTAGSDDKLKACADLGADILINYKEQDFVDALKEATDGRGADVILDIIGAKYLASNVKALAPDGRIVTIGLQGGVKGELNLGALLTKRGTIHATSLRGRSLEGKAEIVAQVREHVWPMVEAGQLKPLVHGRYPLEQVAEAHRDLESSSHIGKLVLDVA